MFNRMQEYSNHKIFIIGMSLREPQTTLMIMSIMFGYTTNLRNRGPHLVFTFSYVLWTTGHKRTDAINNWRNFDKPCEQHKKRHGRLFYVNELLQQLLKLRQNKVQTLEKAKDVYC